MKNLEMSWWDPVYPFEKLEERWNESLQTWINYLQSKTEEEIFEEAEFTEVMMEEMEGRADRHRVAIELSLHSSPGAECKC